MSAQNTLKSITKEQLDFIIDAIHKHLGATSKKRILANGFLLVAVTYR